MHPVGVKRIVMAYAACDKARLKAWNEANREKVRANAAARREAHREEIRVYNRARRAANPDAIRAVESAWRAKNRDHIKAYRESKREVEAERAYMRAYCQKHADEIKARARMNYDAEKQRTYRNANAEAIRQREVAYRARNAARYSANHKDWYARHPGAATVYQRNREARLRDAGQLSPDIIPKLYASQRGLCVCCHQPLGDNYHLDHIIPLCQGGTNTDDNVQLLRAQCNREKHTTDPITFMQRRGFLL